jgi:pimeloyl-ACP methyl ester carboxylesterase
MTTTARVSHGYTEVEGLRLHHLDYGGTGTPIVCIHGVTGHAWTWTAVAPRLAALGTVTALDLRGHGDSQWSAEHRYDTVDHAADLEHWLGLNAGGPVTVVGYSWGALIGIALAARRPDLVHRLAVLDVEASFEQSATDIPAFASAHDSHAAAVAAERAGCPHAPDEVLEVVADAGYRAGEGGKVLPKHDPYFLERWPFRADDVWSDLAELTMPTLFVHAADSFVRLDVMEKMAGLAPDSHFAEVQQCGHVMPVDNPGGLADALVPFLS